MDKDKDVGVELKDEVKGDRPTLGERSNGEAVGTTSGTPIPFDGLLPHRRCLEEFLELLSLDDLPVLLLPVF
jgi:hypothetical protein